MTQGPSPPPGDPDEIPALIETLLETERRLVELTSGEVDAVAGRDGRAFLLRGAQEELRHREATDRAATAVTLDRHQSELRVLFDLMPALIWFKDTHNRILRVNQRVAQAAGRSAAEMEGRPSVDFYPEEAAKYYADDLEVIRSGAAKLGIVERLRDSEGKERWVQTDKVPVRDHDGHVTGIIVMAQDITDRKQSEAALEALSRRTERRERMLSTALSSMSDFAQVYDREGRLLFANQPLLDLWGLALEAVVGKNFIELGYPEALAEQLQRQLESVFTTGQRVTDETPYTSPAGMPGYYEYIFSPICAGDGTVDFVVGTTRDITERKRTAEALQTSLEEFRTLAEAMPQMVWITRPDGWNVYFNQQWTDYTGLTLEESLGHGWNRPFHPEDQPRAWDAWRNATATVGTYSIECRLRRADGIYRWWLIRGVPLRDTGGTILRWLGTCTDIHDLKQAQLEASLSEQRFARIFHSGLMAIGLTEASSGRLIDANERFAELFGYERGEMIGRTVEELGLWAEPAERARFIADFSAGRSAPNREAAYRRKSGEVRPGLISTEAISLAGSAEPLRISIVVDVTERKQLEAQLLQAQKMDAVGRLAGGVAHDFNNSLGVILGYAELLLPKVGEAHRGKLEQILKATHRASGLTRQLLAFSRKQVVDPKVLDLNALLSDLEKMLGRLIGEHIDLTIVGGADLGQVKVDPGQWEQVVINLCVNARDAMPDGGMLRIETANADLDAAYTAHHLPMTPGRYVVLTVGDTGCGMEKEILSKIFEPFFTTKDEGKGTGLGLAMVYGIVKQAGGYVWVYSEIGLGTTFKVYLPRIDEPLAPVVQAASMPAKGWETILLVEDDPSLRAIAHELLEEHGYRVIEASGAEEAIEIAHGTPERIHLLMTDIVMPGMNGRALAESLVGTRPELKVLYMSGYTDDVLAHSRVLESAALLLEKPFTALSLLGRVREALENQA